MPIALRLNMADNAFPTSQWTEAGATKVAPRAKRTNSGFSGCSPTTARMAEVSITISTIYIIQFVQLYNKYKSEWEFTLNGTVTLVLALPILSTT